MTANLHAMAMVSSSAHLLSSIFSPAPALTSLLCLRHSSTNPTKLLPFRCKFDQDSGGAEPALIGVFSSEGSGGRHFLPSCSFATGHMYQDPNHYLGPCNIVRSYIGQLEACCDLTI
ncbi:hypothetical protein ACFX12_040419 [Malus domestica]